MIVDVNMQGFWGEGGNKSVCTILLYIVYIVSTHGSEDIVPFLLFWEFIQRNETTSIFGKYYQTIIELSFIIAMYIICNYCDTLVRPF